MPRAGSSPLARGALNIIRVVGSLAGLIPARAGSTCQDVTRCRRGWAHPRSRGEHASVQTVRRLPQGSSPLARGALGCVPAHLPNPGLIPARAGSTLRECPGGSWRRAHPRSRGEHRNFSTLNGRVGGSSPLARGAPGQPCHAGGTVGLIPARAGSTVLAGSVRRALRAHPRSRGEHRYVLPSRRALQGSSPLARGAH